MIGDYLHNRPNLVCTFVLIDIRHDALAADLEFMEELGQGGIPFHIIFTKADKIKPYQQEEQVRKYKEKLAEMWEEVPPMFVTSAEKNEGRDAVLDTIGSYNQTFEKTKVE